MPLPNPKFPVSVAGAADLLVHINRNASQTLPTLQAAIGSGDTSFTVAAGTGVELPADDFVVTIDNEIIFVTSRTGDVCTVGTRGFEGTTPASHNIGTTVNAFITALAHNQLASEVSSVESQLGSGMKNVATTTGAADGQVPIFDLSSGKYIPGDPIVSGPDAPGTPPTRNPVQTGGFDGTNVRRLLSDASGRLQVGEINSASIKADLDTLASTVSGGDVNVNIASGIANPLPVSAASLPLPANAAKETGGNLATIATDVAPLIAPAAGGYVRQDSNATIAKESGGNLATIAGTVSAGKVAVTDSSAEASLTTLAGAVSGGLSQENQAQWGGTAVSAPPASGVPVVGTEVAPVVKPIQRKNSVVVTTIAPAINTTTYYPGGVTSPTSANWYDAGAVGSVLISLTAYNNPASPNNLIAVEQADDPADTAVTANSCVPLANFPGTNGSNYSLTVSVTKRYWRIRYVNGPTASSTTFKISFTEQAIPAAPLLSTSNGTVAGGGPAGATPSGFGNSVGPVYISAANAGGTVFTGPLGVITYKYTPVSGNMAIDRHVEVLKTAQATALGNTAVWTPAAGKKFRLMRFNISIPAQCKQSVGGIITITFQDSTTGIPHAYDVFVPGTADTISGVDFNSGWIDIGNGILSAAANNVLNVNLSAALTAGNVRVNVAGTEE